MVCMDGFILLESLRSRRHGYSGTVDLSPNRLVRSARVAHSTGKPLTLSVAIGAVSYGLIVWGGRKSAFFMLSTRLPERLLRLLPQCLQTRR